MEIRAAVHNRGSEHSVSVSTDGRETWLSVPAKAEGAGSGVNGGELLCLALATCYCNDLYREAAQRGLRLTSVEVEAAAEFGGPGEPARRITYSARVESDAPRAEIDELIRHTERLAQAAPRLFVAMLGGAAGTFASLGELGPAVQAGISRHLGMQPMVVPARTI
ncbi:MAG TPA: OsmC family protein, partial [Longimicrobiaceae bacterium]